MTGKWIAFDWSIGQFPVLKKVNIMEEKEVILLICRDYPETQAVYLFGSYGTVDVRADSDVDLGVLLPHGNAADLSMAPVVGELENLFVRKVDLINLRRVNTVFQKEIIAGNRRLFCADEAVADEFEMQVLSAYLKLNEERREIIESGLKEGRFVA